MPNKPLNQLFFITKYISLFYCVFFVQNISAQEENSHIIKRVKPVIFVVGQPKVTPTPVKTIKKIELIKFVKQKDKQVTQVESKKKITPPPIVIQQIEKKSKANKIKTETKKVIKKKTTLNKEKIEQTVISKPLALKKETLTPKKKVKKELLPSYESIIKSKSLNKAKKIVTQEKIKPLESKSVTTPKPTTPLEKPRLPKEISKPIIPTKVITIKKIMPIKKVITPVIKTHKKKSTIKPEKKQAIKPILPEYDPTKKHKKLARKKTIRKLPDNFKYPLLRESTDKQFQNRLDSVVYNLGYRRAVNKKLLAITVVDVTQKDQPRVASVNPDVMMYAASLPKIAIFLGVFEKIEQGKLKLTSSLKEHLHKMIRVSSNYSATYLYNKAGKRFIAKTLQSKKYKLYDRKYNGGLWVGKPYGKYPAWKRDPLHNFSHGATTLQTARFYYLLETGRLVSKKRSQQMKQIMANPGTNHKFVKSLKKYRPGSKIYRKSGTWRTYHADSAIIERAGKTYIAVVLAQSRHGGNWIKRLIIHLDDMVFK